MGKPPGCVGDNGGLNRAANRAARGRRLLSCEALRAVPRPRLRDRAAPRTVWLSRCRRPALRPPASCVATGCVSALRGAGRAGFRQLGGCRRLEMPRCLEADGVAASRAQMERSRGRRCVSETLWAGPMAKCLLFDALALQDGISDDTSRVNDWRGTDAAVTWIAGRSRNCGSHHTHHTSPCCVRSDCPPCYALIYYHGTAVRYARGRFS